MRKAFPPSVFIVTSINHSNSLPVNVEMNMQIPFFYYLFVNHDGLVTAGVLKQTAVSRSCHLEYMDMIH